MSTPVPHDLLRIDPAALPADGAAGSARPEWVPAALARAPWVVVRRDRADPAGTLPVGVRGATRGQRWATRVPRSAVERVVRPGDLRPGSVAAPPADGAVADPVADTRWDRVGGRPALAAWAGLAHRWADIGFGWGPTGSVGFELATGLPIATADSDLDVLLELPDPVSPSGVAALLDAAAGLPARVDVAASTPHGGFAAAEYARGGSVVLRTGYGPVVVDDPWHPVDPPGPAVRPGARRAAGAGR